MKRLFVILAISVVPLAGCATTPKPCTQEWVDYKTDRILRKFASENRTIINDLRRLTNAEGDLNTFATLQLMSRADDLQRFGHLGRRELDDDPLLPEIRKHLATDEERVLAVLLLTVDILPGAEPFNNGGEWIHASFRYL